MAYVVALGNGLIPTEIEGVRSVDRALVASTFVAARAGTISAWGAPLKPAPVVTTLSPRAPLTSPSLASEADLMPGGEMRARTGRRAPDHAGTPADETVDDAVETVIGASGGNTEAWVGPPTGQPDVVLVPTRMPHWLCQDPTSRQCLAARAVATWLDRHWKKAAIVALVAVVGLVLLRRRRS